MGQIVKGLQGVGLGGDGQNWNCRIQGRLDRLTEAIDDVDQAFMCTGD